MKNSILFAVAWLFPNSLLGADDDVLTAFDEYRGLYYTLSEAAPENVNAAIADLKQARTRVSAFGPAGFARLANEVLTSPNIGRISDIIQLLIDAKVSDDAVINAIRTLIAKQSLDASYPTVAARCIDYLDAPGRPGKALRARRRPLGP